MELTRTSSPTRFARRVRRGSLTLLLALGVAGVAAIPANAATVNLDGGTTALRLDATTAGALGDLGIAVHRVGSARAIRGGFSFPVTGGRVDPSNAGGFIAHGGGLMLRSSSTSVTLTNFRINTTGTATMSARVNGGRVLVPVLTPDLSAARITRPGIQTQVGNVKVKLSATGAAALRAAFKSDAFTTGLTLGTATVALKPREVAFAGGGTELTVPQATVDVLTSLGVAPGVSGGATLTTAGAFRFPVTGGKVRASSLAGAITHSGGLTLTKGATVVTLSNYTIDTVRSELRGQVNGSAPVALFKLDLTSPKLTIASQRVTVGGVGATLTAGAASALNAAFGVTAFTEGISFGTAVVKGEIS